MTTEPFARPAEPVPAPQTGGGKIAVDAPIVAPIPPQRHWAAIVFPIALIVGVVGFIIAMYVSGMRTFASGFGIFGVMMLVGMGGMLFRGRGAAQKMSWSQLEQYRREYFSRLDDVRDEVEVSRRQQWEHRAHFHWEPDQLVGVAGTPRMWERRPGDDEFAVVRIGVGKIELAMTIEKPKIAEASRIEPATGHALRKFLLEQQHVCDVAKVIWLQRYPGLSVVGEMDQARAVARAMTCQLAAFHSPADVQIMVVTAAPTQWEWAKWLPHLQHRSQRDGCGERRLLFSSAAELEIFLDEAEDSREAWSPPASGLHGDAGRSAGPFRVIVDDHCGTPEDWAGLTGQRGYAGTCFVRLAPAVPAPPASGVSFGPPSARTWVGFDPATTYRLVDGVLRKRMPLHNGAVYGAAKASDEIEDEFYAEADTLSSPSAERFARAIARYRAAGSGVVAAKDDSSRTLLDVLAIRDPRRLDVDRLWAARRTQGRDWLRFPIGADPSGQLVELDLKEGSQGGMNMHSILIGTTGAGKSEAIITEVTSLALTHSPEVVNVVFSDFKLKSAAGVLQRFPHVVASVSNLGTEQHLVGRMHAALDGELDRRGELCAAYDCMDLNVYNERRLSDPSLPPVPALFIICDEYQEMLGHPVWGPDFQKLFWRIVRQGRAYHMFLQLVGQTVDLQKLRDIRKLLGFTIAMRTGREEDSRDAIDSAIAAHVPEKGAEGTAFLRVAQLAPREFRTFFSSAEFAPPSEDAGVTTARAGSWFNPRPFTAAQATDSDGLLAYPQQARPDPVAAPEPVAPLAPGQLKPKVVDKVIESLQASGVGPPRQLWLPPLGEPPAADDLVARMRGRAWHLDYGDNAGLLFPVGIEDRPREHRQNVHCLDLLSANALVVGAPQRGATTTMLTMITTGALMYRPERVQFYCIAASGAHLAGVAELPHVAGVAAAVDREGVNRVIATVRNIVAEREALFARNRLDMDTVRRAKFGPNPVDVGVSGGDVVLIIDGWANFATQFEMHVDTILALMRARNYGVRVVITHTSYLSGLKQSIKPEAKARVELGLTDPRESEMDRAVAREVPDTPGRGVTAGGHHLIIGVPELANWPGGRVEVRGLAAVVTEVSGVAKVTTVARLPEAVPVAEVNRLADPARPRTLVPFGLSENTLGPAYIDFADHPHAVAVGNPGSGRTNFLRVMCRAIMAAYTPEEAKLIVFDPRRTLLGVVQGDHLAAYAYTTTAIKQLTAELCGELERRQPPPGTSQQDMLSRQFWSGPRYFVIADDAGAWTMMDNPMIALSNYVEQARETGLHVLAATMASNWNMVAIGSSVLGRLRSSLAPILILDGRRDAGKIAADIYAEPQRPGKAIYFTRSSTVGALIGWSEPPASNTPNAAG
ncbi:type VII secretion protein EccCa [Mycobacterium sp.]|uniref:type VII secretion protein EccCa n=1 Tax=Mycobacterium sp. TaxID=1785 RepID=UPI002D6FDF13|nr:type VII secretion protein EccCa [Mycobacterium sp.]HZA10649.1 type VII secretion protein EccCa [Mycobacterium sp.]